ncbi:hypothetical protein [Spirillospora sp. NBC_01491]|uniref:hypothetical protein n=1 Tax=Spirillospora sp. NBC_01491 TaxID=2976007 RepID=UPI002E3720C9|nr:hypothetical protein [Spirillospora sp. NBC_01491]
MTAAPRIITEDGEPVVHLDLDAIEDEATSVTFTFRVGGEVFSAISPDDADWQATADTDSPGGLRAFIHELLGDEDYERFCELTVSNRKLGQIVEGAQKHYGIKTGESKASPRSSKKRRRR